ncbi:MAG: hypothetical protein IIB60_00760 [Planctomycetes bacterium]|nr:hypothetical protein [Planctomycetota bacterium]
MEPLSPSVNDLCYHVVEIGLDAYPPVSIPDERTRLNMFYEEARERWGNLFGRLVASDTEFKISKEFRRTPDVQGPAHIAATFVLTNRGPVYAFPLVLPDPINETGLEATYLDDFVDIHRLFFSILPGHGVMRVGLVRELVFTTGEAPSNEILTRQGVFANAKLVGGQSKCTYRDEFHNHQILVEPVSLTKATRLPIGTVKEEHTGYGVRVRLDVNNAEVNRQLEETDIQQVLDRARSLWPDTLLEYLRERSRS